MNNDLISRSELRKCAIPCSIHNGALTDMCVPLYQIDSAPTVEITEKQAILLLINSGWLVNHDKELREKWERPQGEWQVKDNLSEGSYICSNCGEISCCKGNFCPNCGTDMRGKKNDNKNA